MRYSKQQARDLVEPRAKRNEERGKRKIQLDKKVTVRDYARVTVMVFHEKRVILLDVHWTLHRP